MASKTDDELKSIIVDLIVEIDGNITYGDLWDIKPENKEAFENAIKILKREGL